MSSDERREVANQLRDARPSTYYDEELVDLIKDALLPAYPVETWREPTDVLSALADLIDHTCHMVDTDHEQEDSIRCDVCQMTFNRPWEPFKFCPNCGARVVSGNGE